MSRDSDEMWRLAGRYSAVGIELAVSVTLGTIGGAWLDRKLGTDPWLLWFGIIVGIGAATRVILRVVRDYRRRPGSSPVGKVDETPRGKLR